MRMLWGKDGKNRDDDPQNFAAILLDWMTKADNYTKYHGFNNGTQKIEVCKKVAQRINKAGVVKTQSLKIVKKKIEAIEKQMQHPFDFESSLTGVDLMQSSYEKDQKT